MSIDPRVALEALTNALGEHLNAVAARRGENDPANVLDTQAFAIAYREHPYHHPTIGSMEDLNAATLNDVKEWYATYYGPNNAVLVLAGVVGGLLTWGLSTTASDGAGRPAARRR